MATPSDTDISDAPVLRERLDALAERLGGLTRRDRARLERRLGELRQPSSERSRDASPGRGRRRRRGPAAGGRERAAVRDSEGVDDAEARIEARVAEAERQIEEAERRVAARRAAVPSPRYPAELPIVARREEILAALADHQVLIVAGETGSGKSTQLPKLCLEAGFGVTGMIGHTQPRRLAARAVAERVAEELGGPVGGVVGYTVRFTDRVGDDTLVKVMTDGILLAELQRDRQLDRYEVIIVDEAHERSLNIDFILGYLKRLLPLRPDLKVIVTSATIDTERFSRHFDGAPIIEVSGRTWPVEVRYRPLSPGATGTGADNDDDSGNDDDNKGRDEPGVGPPAGEERDQTQAICDAVQELAAEGPGDVLVFLSGERDIRDSADALRALDLADTEILPLYARLSAAEQHRVFQAHRGRRIVLATNVAETSLTVPGIRYVIDPGTARISRYNRRTKVQRLPIEAVSQASANQRAGRCGRVAPGICIRLYAEDDFAARPQFTDPEILRTNLASVILQMAAIGLGDIAAFPFVEPPDARSIRDGVALLEELGALDPDEQGTRRWLTPLGRRLAELPIDPRLGRMILEAERYHCVREVTIIAAALSIQDPRERPTGKEQAAAEQHRRFAREDSDLLAWLALWEHLQESQRELSSSQFRRRCKAEYLNFLRVREWQDLYSQLRQATRSLGLRTNHDAADADSVHRSVLAGLLSHIGLRDPARNDYQGARQARFVVAGGSVLQRRSARWVMAAELVETNRLWARGVARIRPEWAEQAGAHLVKRSYGDPQWDPERGGAVATERVTLYGLPIVAGRRVDYHRVDPVAARDLFIRYALVEGDWPNRHRFLEANRAAVAEVRALEERARRRGKLLPDDALVDFYDRQVDAQITSGRHFDRWWKKERAADPHRLEISVEQLLAAVKGDEGVDAHPARDTDEYPDQWQQGELTLALAYEFDPGSETDGVTAVVPLAVLNQLHDRDFDWQVPGLRRELVVALIRSLPKTLRRSFLPVAEVASAFLAEASPADGALLEVLARFLAHRAGVPVPLDNFQLERVATHLRLGFLVVDEDGSEVAAGKDLGRLQERLDAPMRAAISAAVSPGITVGVTPGVAPVEANPPGEVAGLRAWTFGALPAVVERATAGHTVRAYPALVDEGASVAVRTLTSAAEADAATWAGTRRLLRLTLPSPARAVEDVLTRRARFALARRPNRSVAELVDDCVDAAVDELVATAGGPAREAEGFAALQRSVRASLAPTAVGIAATVAGILTTVAEIEGRLASLTLPTLQPAVGDMRSQLTRLVYPGFVSGAGAGRLADVARYVEGIAKRLDRLPTDAAKDRERMVAVRRLEGDYDRLLERSERGPGVGGLPAAAAEELEELGWELEELRVSLFAQVLGTRRPVSATRIGRTLTRLATA